jgi:mannan endo-1,4-beta-mannosidase
MFMKKRAVLVAVIVPVAAAAAAAGVLVSTHHTAVPPLGSPAKSGHARSTTPASCPTGAVRMPFAGVAINASVRAHVTSFVKATGTPVRVAEFFDAFTSPFQRWEAAQATALDATPLIQLNPRHISLARIAAGGYDSMIRKYARAVKSFRCTIILSFGHEMNGWWYTWGRPWTRPATFIAAWRHIHDIFAAHHVTNVIWSWDPTHQYQHKGASPASEWYPGNAYVDWVGIDGYLGKGQNFADVFTRQLHYIRSVTRKPVFLAETGVAGGPAQGWQIANLFGSLKKDGLSGLIWFDVNRKQPWRLEGRPAALAAYRKGVASLGAASTR